MRVHKGKYFLSRLPRDVQSRVRNLIRQTGENDEKSTVTAEKYLAFMLNDKNFDSMQSFLEGAFVFSDTYEGKNYWINIIKTYSY